MRPIEALSHFGLGELAHQMCDHVMAHEEFLTATAIFRDLSMQFWVDKTAAALAELR
jgi:hypothetical protein